MTAGSPARPGALSGKTALLGGALAAGIPLVLAVAVAVLTGSGAFGGGSASAATPVLACGPVSAGMLDPQLGTIGDDQISDAATIYSVATAMGLPDRAALVATEASLGEARLHNPDSGDADSLGILQERPSQGWGTPAQIMDPAYAAAQFYDRLPAGWQTLDPAVVDQTIEASAHPEAYAPWAGLAARFVATENGTAACTPDDGWTGPTGAGAPPAGTLPAGYTVPAGTSPQVATAITFALAQLGKPYLYGGTGPNAWDCSGLMQAAYAAAGITLPRTSQEQVTVGTPVYDQTQLQPGDLIFIAGDDGTAAAPGHVGMYLGTLNGTPLVLHAPHTGDVVRIDSLTGWPVVAIRRITTTTAPPA